MLCLDYSALDNGDKKFIQFVDNDTWQPMFLLEDGKKLLFHDGFDHTDCAVVCRYIDPYHFYFGSTVYHIHQFAEVMQRNGHTYAPLNCVQDLATCQKIYLDRELKGEDGKRLPYHILVGQGSGTYSSPEQGIAFCPQAERNRQICVFNRSEGIQTRFMSAKDLQEEIFNNNATIGIPSKDTGLDRIFLAPIESDMLVATMNQYRGNMPHLTQASFDAIPDDYKGVYADFHGTHPLWKGRKTAMLPGQGTTLSIEGISFVIDEGKSLDKQIKSAQCRTGVQSPAQPGHEQER